MRYRLEPRARAVEQAASGSPLASKAPHWSLAIYVVSGTWTRFDHDDAAFTETDIGILSINDPVTHAYFHLVGAGGDVQSPRSIVVGRCLSDLHAVYKHDRTHRGSGHDDLRGVRQRLRFPRTEPAAGG